MKKRYLRLPPPDTWARWFELKRLQYVELRTKREARYGDWHRWYAWYPVRILGGYIKVWRRWVWRRGWRTTEGTWIWDYML